MAKKKVTKKTVKPVAEPVTEVVKEVKVVKTEDKTSNKEESKVVNKKPTIFDKHRRHINTVKEGYLKKLSYEDAMDMLRYIQKHTGHQLGLNMSCSNCLIELVQIFMRLEKK